MFDLYSKKTALIKSSKIDFEKSMKATRLALKTGKKQYFSISDEKLKKKLKESAKHLGFVFDCRRLNTKEL